MERKFFADVHEWFIFEFGQLQFQLVWGKMFAILTTNIMLHHFGHWVFGSKVLVAPPLVLLQMLFSRMVTQDLSGSLAINRNVSLTDLALKFIWVPPRIDRPRHKSLCPLHAFKVRLLHDVTGTRDPMSADCTA